MMVRRRMWRARLGPVWAATLSIAVAACGGDSGSGTEDPAADGTSGSPTDSDVVSGDVNSGDTVAAVSYEGIADQQWPAEPAGVDAPNARQPFRVGQWYASDPHDLSKQVGEAISAVDPGEPPRPARAVIVPHAGLKASGPVAAQVWARVVVPETVIVLAPNHADTGARAAIWPDGPWVMPGLAMETDDEVVAKLRAAIPALEADRAAFDHILAHPSEMQLPWLSRLNPTTKIVMVSFYDYEKITYVGASAEDVAAWGKALAEVVEELADEGRDVLVVASTDLSHYIPQAEAAVADGDMMGAIKALDAAGLRDVVTENAYSICSEVPLSVLIEAAKAWGYEALDWSTYGDSSHLSGTDSVVGYPGGILW